MDEKSKQLEQEYNRKSNNAVWLSTIIILVVLILGGVVYTLAVSNQSPNNNLETIPGIGGGPGNSLPIEESPTPSPSATPVM